MLQTEDRIRLLELRSREKRPLTSV